MVNTFKLLEQTAITMPCLCKRKKNLSTIFIIKIILCLFILPEKLHTATVNEFLNTTKSIYICMHTNEDLVLFGEIIVGVDEVILVNT